MQLWFARASTVSLQEQLKTQIILGILSGDLAPGQRLPSTRELARRYRLHPNTISAGYRQLERDRWVEFRRGSGIYIRDRRPQSAAGSAMSLDRLLADLMRSARELGIPLSAVRLRVRQWLEVQPPDHFLLVEGDEELRRILAAEIQEAVDFPLESCGLEDGLPAAAQGAIALALANKAKLVREVVPEGIELITLAARSVPTSLAGWLPAPPGALLGIVSRWPEFLKLARTILTAAGFHPDSLVFRDARKSGWERGLKQTSAIICDTLTAKSLPKGSFTISFPVLSEASIAELQRYHSFITAAL